MRANPLSVVLLAGCLGALGATRLPAADAPRAVIERLTSRVLAVLGDRGLPTAEKRHRVEELVYADVDFDTLSRLVLARNWRRFTPAQQADFVREFRRHLALTYGADVENYRNERVAIERERAEPDGDWTVRTRVLRGGPEDIEIDYRLRQTAGEWKIIDFVIEHVSLVADYRGQFQDIMGRGGPDEVLRLLHEKNARGEPLHAPRA